jgi:hypothetical protein
MSEAITIFIELISGLGPAVYSASLAGEMEEELCQSNDPFLDAARVLKSRGIDPNTRIQMVRKNNPGVVTLSSTVGKAAGLRVKESGSGVTFTKWEPFSEVAKASLRKRGNPAAARARRF